MVDTKCRDIDARLARLTDELSRSRSALARNADANARLRAAMADLCLRVRESIVESRKRLGEMTRRPDTDSKAALLHAEKGLPPARLRRVTDYIDASLSERLNVATLAAVAGMSRGHFAAMFKRSTGLAPHRFVLNRRLARSRELLADESLGIATIGCQLGFSSQAHFTTAFRQRFRTTPSAFRNAQRGARRATNQSWHSRISRKPGRQSEESESRVYPGASN